MTLVERLAELARRGATPNGIDRALFTSAEHEARTVVAAWARADGMTIEQDRVGNVFMRLPGTAPDLAPLQCGSHLDTVKDGGAYDGAYGVIGGLEAVRRLAARGERLRHTLEVVAWAGEEGSRFPLGCLGSAAFAGLNAFDDIDALRDENGMTFAQARASETGLLPGVPVRAQTVVPSAYVELHIEQGPVLEANGARLCMTSEWQFACEGEEMRPYPYGWKRDATACNVDVMTGLGRVGRLVDHRAPASAHPRCVSPFGVHDMSGNVDEWATGDGAPRGKREVMKGSWWLPGRHACRSFQGGHGPLYGGTETGARCCKAAE